MRALVLLAALCVSGCASWTAAEPARPGAAGWLSRPGDVRVTLRDGSEATVRDPVVVGDSVLTGQVGGATTAYALDDVRAAHVRQRSRVGTALILSGGAVVGFALAVAAGVLALENSGFE